MTPSPKYILHSPLVDSASLEPFVERCLSENASLIAVFGFGSAELEDIIDEIIVGDGEDSNRYICTTSHPDETFDEALSFVTAWEADEGGAINETRF